MKNEENVSADQDTQNVESEVPEESADSLAPVGSLKHPVE